MSVVAAKGSSSGKNFWTKMLSAQKVKRILEKRGLDPESFRKNYESDTNRGPRRASRPSDKEVNSVEAFLKTGDYPGLMTSLGTKSRPKADAAIRRVVAWKGQGGVKKRSRKS
ncbi:MAG: hypothetical protein ACJAYI_000518 [Myxococcota bacterium]|jgi:hypothetical protein